MSDITSKTEQMEAYMAWRRGETVEVMTVNTCGWLSFSPTGTLLPHYILRRKPKPTLRRWKPEEVPVGALIRMKGDARINLILSRDTAGFKICSHGCEPVLHDVLASEFKFEDYEFSKTFGDTWHPCGIVE